MNKPEEDELSEEKRKKEGYSIIVALIAVLIIGISFIWHLLSALFPVPTPLSGQHPGDATGQHRSQKRRPQRPQPQPRHILNAGRN